jgi:hypothetical protein
MRVRGRGVRVGPCAAFAPGLLRAACRTAPARAAEPCRVNTRSAFTVFHVEHPAPAHAAATVRRSPASPTAARHVAARSRGDYDRRTKKRPTTLEERASPRPGASPCSRSPGAAAALTRARPGWPA